MDQSSEEPSEASALRFWILNVLRVKEHEAHRNRQVLELVKDASDRVHSCGLQQFCGYLEDGSSIFVLQDEIKVGLCLGQSS